MSFVFRKSVDVAPARDQVDVRDWFSLFVLASLYILSMIDRSMLAVVVDDLKKGLDLTDTKFSLLIGGPFALVYALIAIPCGFLVDKMKRRTVIIFGLVGWSMFTVLCGLSSTFPHLLAARVGVAVGEASLLPAAYSMIPDIFPKRHLTLATAIFSMGGAIGAALAPIFTGNLLWSLDHGWLSGLPHATQMQPWQLVFVMIGSCGAPLLLPLFLMAEPKRKPVLQDCAGNSKRTSLQSYLFSYWRVNLALFGGFAMAGLVGYSVAFWSPAYLLRTFQLVPQRVGSILGTILLICTLISAPASGVVCDLFLRRGVGDIHFRTYIVAALIGTPILAISLICNNLALFLAAFVLYALVITPQGGLAFSAIQLSAPANLRGRVSALFLFVYNKIGLGFGPPVVAVITDRVLHDEAKVGVAIAITISVANAMAVLFLLTGLRALATKVNSAVG